jgi:hypothetical protein
LADRPAAYEDVGRLCRWGSVIHELKHFESELRLLAPQVWGTQTIDQFVLERQEAREKHCLEPANVSGHVPAATPSASYAPKAKLLDEPPPRPLPESPRRMPRPRALLLRGRNERPGKVVAKRLSSYVDRRRVSLLDPSGDKPQVERRSRERRQRSYAVPFPDRRLARSAYEQVFLKLVSGGRLRMGRDVYTPIGMKGWYHAVFRRESDGAEKMLTIDQLLKKMNDWT